MSDSQGPVDCSLPGSSVHGISQLRMLEWVAILFSRRPSWGNIMYEVKVAQLKSLSCVLVLWPRGLEPARLLCLWNSPGQNTGVGSCSLLQGIFPTQGLTPGLPHCRRILYQLSHHGSPRILEWAACPFSSGSSWPRNWTEVSSLQMDFFFYQLSYQGNIMYKGRFLSLFFKRK